MKLRYFIPTIMTALAILVGCSDNNDPTYLDNLKVSKSFVSLPTEGGSVEINVKANQAWNITQIPDWLTVFPESGEAGDTKVTLTAAATTETLLATLHLNSDGMVQEISVIQYAEKKEPEIITVSEALDLIKAGQEPAVYVKGTVCRIQEISTSYGNATYFISDNGKYEDGKWLEIYRGYWLEGEKFTKGDEISVGDIVVVSGTLKDYNGTPEFNTGSQVISVEKSLLSVESVEIEGGKLPVEGGDFKVNLINKGQGLDVNIPDAAKDWLFITGISMKGQTTVVSFRAAANTAGERSATIGFATTDSGIDYTAEATVTQNGSVVDMTVADFLAAEVGAAQYRITGVIKSLYDSDKQGKSFTIGDWSGDVLVYRAEGFIEAGAKVGDVVTVVGQRGAYKETPQMVSGTFEELKYAVTKVTIDEFLTKEDADNVYYMVTGIVDEIANPTYGNLYLKSGETRLSVYGCYPGWGASGDARKGCIDNYGIEVGDELTVIGVKSTFNGTPQLKNGIYFSYAAAGSE